MLNIKKTEAPVQYKNLHKQQLARWEDIDFNMRNCLKENMLQNEQNHCCAYCEREIRKLEKGHIEHIKPRSQFPKEMFDYTNMVVSCQDDKTCGKHKKGVFSNDFINPVSEQPEDYLSYNLYTGAVIASEEIVKSRADYTIDLLNLNENQLKETRRNFIKKYEGLKQHFSASEIIEWIREENMFYSLINHYIQEGL